MIKDYILLRDRGEFERVTNYMKEFDLSLEQIESTISSIAVCMRVKEDFFFEIRPAYRFKLEGDNTQDFSECVVEFTKKGPPEVKEYYTNKSSGESYINIDPTRKIFLE